MYKTIADVNGIAPVSFDSNYLKPRFYLYRDAAVSHIAKMAASAKDYFVRNGVADCLLSIDEKDGTATVQESGGTSISWKTQETPEVKPLKRPLSLEEMKGMCDERYFIEGIVEVDVADLIDNDLEAYLDILSEKLTGTSLLMDIESYIVGCDDETLLICVSGDASGAIDDLEAGDSEYRDADFFEPEEEDSANP